MAQGSEAALADSIDAFSIIVACVLAAAVLATSILAWQQRLTLGVPLGVAALSIVALAWILWRLHVQTYWPTIAALAVSIVSPIVVSIAGRAANQGGASLRRRQ